MMRNLRTAGALSALILAAACATEPPGPTGRVRFVNMITDTTLGRVNVTLDGKPFGVNLTYGQSIPSPSYSRIPEGIATLVLKRTADTSVTVATMIIVGDPAHDFTFYALGGAGGSEITTDGIADLNPDIPKSATRVRAINMSPTAGAADIFLTAPNADLSAATPTFANVAFNSEKPYATPAPGTYQVRIVRAGTAPALRAAAVLVNMTSLVLAGGTGRTIVVADRNIGGLAPSAFVLTDR